MIVFSSAVESEWPADYAPEPHVKWGWDGPELFRLLWGIRLRQLQRGDHLRDHKSHRRETVQPNGGHSHQLPGHQSDHPRPATDRKRPKLIYTELVANVFECLCTCGHYLVWLWVCIDQSKLLADLELRKLSYLPSSGSESAYVLVSVSSAEDNCERICLHGQVFISLSLLHC